MLDVKQTDEIAGMKLLDMKMYKTCSADIVVVVNAVYL